MEVYNQAKECFLCPAFLQGPHVFFALDALSGIMERDENNGHMSVQYPSSIRVGYSTGKTEESVAQSEIDPHSITWLARGEEATGIAYARLSEGMGAGTERKFHDFQEGQPFALAGSLRYGLCDSEYKDLPLQWQVRHRSEFSTRYLRQAQPFEIPLFQVRDGSFEGAAVELTVYPRDPLVFDALRSHQPGSIVLQEGEAGVRFSGDVVGMVLCSEISRDRATFTLAQGSQQLQGILDLSTGTGPARVSSDGFTAHRLVDRVPQHL